MDSKLTTLEQLRNSIVLMSATMPSNKNYGKNFISIGRDNESAVGTNSVAIGTDVAAIGTDSHAEGNNTVASGRSSHAEGIATHASGNYSHAEGSTTYANGESSHSEGTSTVANADNSHSEGFMCTALGETSHAEGFMSGTDETAQYSHAEGEMTTANATASHAEGLNTSTTGDYSTAMGMYSVASNYASCAMGKYNAAMTNDESSLGITGDAFVIGNGTGSNDRSNAFRVTFAGEVYALSAFNSSGADYAEFIAPWYDDNSEEEDRVGYFVTVKEDGLLHKADEGDVIVGITSGNPSIVGNSDEDFNWKYERDEFGRFIWEDTPVVDVVVDKDDSSGDDSSWNITMQETGEIVEDGKIKVNDSFDTDAQESYVTHKDSMEWDYVGLIGVLSVRDDGSCVVGGFCKCANGGIATYTEERGFDTYVVIERKSNNVVSVVLK